MDYLHIFMALLAIFTFGAVDSARLKRQSDVSQPNGAVIDSIFNIPITAIKQTAAAVQTFSPENSGTIDSVFKIPITTLEAVGQLVKNRSPQRRQEVQEEMQRRQQEKRERMIRKREQLKFQKIKKEELKKKKLLLQDERYFHHKDPLGLNALTNVLVGHHGILGGHGGHGNHGIQQGTQENQGTQGTQGTQGSHTSHTYEVHEVIDEPPFTWPGWPSSGNAFASQSTFSPVKIENKIAPKDSKEDIENYKPEDDPPENKISPKIYKKYGKSTLRMDKRSSIRFESDPAPAGHKSANFFPSN